MKKKENKPHTKFISFTTSKARTQNHVRFSPGIIRLINWSFYS